MFFQYHSAALVQFSFISWERKGDQFITVMGSCMLQNHVSKRRSGVEMTLKVGSYNSVTRAVNGTTIGNSQPIYLHHERIRVVLQRGE
jgi:hypothetical protein